ncbi:MAG: glycosyltransferase family 4 protein [Pseudomonadota bacterium]
MTDKPRILFVSDVPDFKGGAERSLFDLMSNPGIEPHSCVPEEGAISAEAQKRGITNYTLDYGAVRQVRRPFKISDIINSFSSTFSAAKQLKSLCINNQIDILHTNGLKAHGVACFARILGGPPVIAHFRAIPFTPLEKIFWRAVKTLSSALILVSRPCWPGKELPSKAQVVFNAIDVPEDIQIKAPPQKPFILGFAGRIQFTKGVLELIDWVDYALAKDLDFKLLIRGEAAPDEQGYFQDCIDKVAVAGLKERIIFEGRKEGLENIFAGLHANIVPSIVPDPLPRSVMEASALGLPVLAYPAGGIPYMFEDGISGFLVKNEKEFYETLKSLIEDEALRDSVSKAARENAEERFTMPRLHAEVLEIYRSVSARDR